MTTTILSPCSCCGGCCCPKGYTYPYFYSSSPYPYATDLQTCNQIGGIFYTGQHCGSLSCPPAKSACCVDGECKGPMEQSECAAAGGNWQSDPGGLLWDCSWPPPIGVGCGCCCTYYYNGPDPYISNEWQCSNYGGTWFPNQKCSTLSCLGACCTTGGCTQTYQYDCMLQNGAWKGAGTPCSPDPCPILGACCNNGICTIEEEANCPSPAIWKGAKTNCDPELKGSFNQPLEGCEIISKVATVTNTLGVPAMLEASGGANDEVLINGKIYEPGKYAFGWGITGTDCQPDYNDNGAHSWSYFKVLAPGESVDFGGKDNSFGGGIEGTWTLRTCFDPKGACCFNDGTCTEGTQNECAQSGGNWQGADTRCYPNPCEPVGACCHVDGSCTYEPKSKCTSSGGSWSAGTCSPNPCPQPGSCCDNGKCSITFSDECPGTWKQGGVCPTCPVLDSNCKCVCDQGYEECGGKCVPICNDQICGPIFGQPANGPGYSWLITGRNSDCSCKCQVVPNGTCCDTYGNCTITNQANCPSGSDWQSQKTCAQISCVPTGACCTGTQCLKKTEAECLAISGSWKGVGTFCSTNPCGFGLGACCDCNGDCHATSESGCFKIVWQWPPEVPSQYWVKGDFHEMATCGQIDCISASYLTLDCEGLRKDAIDWAS